MYVGEHVDSYASGVMEKGVFLGDFHYQKWQNQVRITESAFELDEFPANKRFHSFIYRW